MKKRVLDSKPFAIIVYILVTCWTLHSWGATSPPKCAKKFGQALVLAGGGITPGMALGILAGARAAGYKPDVVITTCGASISGAIANAFPTPEAAHAFVKSRQFHSYLRKHIQVGGTSVAELGVKMARHGSDWQIVPEFFDKNLMQVPTPLPPLLDKAKTQFNSQGETRFVTVAARALFGREHARVQSQVNRLYKQIYFTDPDTAKALTNLPASMKQNFPEAPIDPATETVTGVSTIEALRASIADPFLMDPATITDPRTKRKDLYFAGAMDLFPVETAKAIACDVTVTKPSGDYSMMEDRAVQAGFGFSQRERVAQLKKYRGVRWVKTEGVGDFAMDPDVSGMEIVSKIPEDYQEFSRMIEMQYQLGYERALEAYGGGGAARETRTRRQQHQGVR